jgi:hypothetical protein
MNSNKNIRFFLLVLLLPVLLFSSCSDKKKGIIDKEEFIDIYSDLLLINSNPKYNQEERKEKINELLSNHNIDQNSIWNTVSNFDNNPGEWKDIYKEIINKLELKKQKFIKNIK